MTSRDLAMERFNDLQRQGFMKPLKARTPKAPPVIVACAKCQDWHRKGKHTKAYRPEKPAHLAEGPQ